MMKLTRTCSAIVTLAALSLATSCDSEGSDSSTSRSEKPLIGVDVPRTDSDFWNSYGQFLRKRADSGEFNTLPIGNSFNDSANMVDNIRVFTNVGAKAIVMAPQDTAAVDPVLKRLATAGIPVVTVDTRPDNGKVYMVVRGDNRAYGTKACLFLGKQLGGQGKVAELQGDLHSVNGRDRSEGFATCMKDEFPNIKVYELPTDWKGDVASSRLQRLLAQHPDLNGIYMQSGGVFLYPTLQLLRKKGLLKTVGQEGHIHIVSNDGDPQEFDAIRRGEIDATVSQPADLYAKYALYYAQAAGEGKTFEPGRTDHGSTIIKLPGGLEDQLPAPLVTRENVDDSALWANTLPE